MSTPERDYFAEAVAILSGESMMLPEFNHLEAMALIGDNHPWWKKGLKGCAACGSIFAKRKFQVWKHCPDCQAYLDRKKGVPNERQ